MGFAIYHAEKGKGSGGGIGHHIDRTEGMKHTYPHADPNRKDLNVNFKTEFSDVSIPEAIQKRISEGYQGEKKVRQDAVKYMTHIFTGSPDEMKKIFSDPKQKNDWIKANSEFLKKEFGSKNVIRFNLHLDEKTPHIHAVTVPLTEDGRLSAKQLMGNKKELQERQDRYAEAMRPFGLERGLRNTGIKHENAKEYYNRISDAQKKASEMKIEPVKSLGIISKSKTIEKLEKELKSSYMAFNDLKNKSKTKDVAYGNQNSLIERQNRNLKKLQKDSDHFKKEAIKIIKSPELSEKLRNQIEKNEVKEKSKGFSR